MKFALVTLHNPLMQFIASTRICAKRPARCRSAGHRCRADAPDSRSSCAAPESVAAGPGEGHAGCAASQRFNDGIGQVLLQGRQHVEVAGRIEQAEADLVPQRADLMARQGSSPIPPLPRRQMSPVRRIRVPPGKPLKAALQGNGNLCAGRLVPPIAPNKYELSCRRAG